MQCFVPDCNPAASVFTAVPRFNPYPLPSWELMLTNMQTLIGVLSRDWSTIAVADFMETNKSYHINCVAVGNTAV